MALGVTEQSSAARARQALFALGTPRTPMVAHPGWRSTLDKATAAIEGGKKVVAILGPEGVGKTTLLHEIAHVARQGIARPVTVLDDADQLGGAVMQRVAEVGNGCLLLAGRPELALELSLMGPEAAIISMGRVWQADVPAYLDALCEQTGQAAALISPEAMERLGAVSSGLPGVLMSVARMAALVAAAAKADRVEAAHVERAAHLYAGREVLPTSPAALAALLGGEEEHETTPGASVDASPPRQEPRAAVRPPSRPGPAGPTGHLHRGRVRDPGHGIGALAGPERAFREPCPSSTSASIGSGPEPAGPEPAGPKLAGTARPAGPCTRRAVRSADAARHAASRGAPAPAGSPVGSPARASGRARAIGAARRASGCDRDPAGRTGPRARSRQFRAQRGGDHPDAPGARPAARRRELRTRQHDGPGQGGGSGGGAASERIRDHHALAGRPRS